MRRSQRSKLLLPLDLHVLGLPLAFILSQDQTLHRILFVRLTLTNCSIQVASLFNINRKILLSLFFQICIATNLCCQFNMSMNVSFFFCSQLFQLAGAKVQLFFNLASFFEKKFKSFFTNTYPIFLRTYTPQFSRFGSAKILPLLSIIQIFFELFLKFF